MRVMRLGFFSPRCGFLGSPRGPRPKQLYFKNDPGRGSVPHCPLLVLGLNVRMTPLLPASAATGDPDDNRAAISGDAVTSTCWGSYNARSMRWFPLRYRAI